jgi:hypothetical protein
VYRGEDSVVAATGTPARLGTAIIIQREITILDLERPVTF